MTTPHLELYREIHLTKGQVSLVDASDFDWLNRWKWRATWANNTQSFYATRYARQAENCGSVVSMHRAILELGYGDKRQGDHINHDTLDNRRSNLRLATQSQNMHNKRVYSNNRTGLKGVSADHGRYKARIKTNGTIITLGWSDTAEGAHALYREACVKYFGEFAKS